MKHCILVKFQKEIGKQQKEALYPQIRALFSQLLDMDGIVRVDVIPNVVDRENRYDLLIRIDMNPSALTAYDQSAVHQKWKTDYGKLLASKAIFDYEA